MPDARTQALVRHELCLVGHFGAVADPVSQVDVREFEPLRLADLPDDAGRAQLPGRPGSKKVYTADKPSFSTSTNETMTSAW